MLTNFKQFSYNGQVISQRADGYINLTQMSKANGKRIDHWRELKATKSYIKELQDNYPESRVVYTEEGVNGGTWGHPSLAINLARWISPQFAVWCDAHIFNLMTSGSTSLDIDPLEEMKLKLKLLQAEKEVALAQQKLIDTRYLITQTCPEPVQQKVLGYQVIEKTEKVEVVVDRKTGKEYDGVGITYIAKSLGFKSNEQCWAWLNLHGYGKKSGKWKDELSAIHTPKLSRDDFQYLKDIYLESQGRQLFLGE